MVVMEGHVVMVQGVVMEVGVGIAEHGGAHVAVSYSGVMSHWCYDWHCCHSMRFGRQQGNSCGKETREDLTQKDNVVKYFILIFQITSVLTIMFMASDCYPTYPLENQSCSARRDDRREDL